MDLGLIFGLLGTWIVIFMAILAGGSLGIFWNTASVTMVIGGTLMVTVATIPARRLASAVSVFKRGVFPEKRSIEKLIEDLVSYAEIARRDGILSLENATKDIDDEFIVRGIQMAVDGTDPELIEQIMESELENVETRHESGKFIFDTIGKYAPALGMIGTLCGLVIMLMSMSDPSAIGEGMAVAILTTLYGAIIANGFALPMSERLAQRSSEEILYKTIIIKGVMAIQSGDNPRVVEQKLRTFLPPSARSDGSKKEAA